MREAEVRAIFQNKDVVINGISSCNDDSLREKLTLIMNNLILFESNYGDLIEGLISSPVNYSSYYNSGYTALENIEYFKSCYQKSDKDEQLGKYLLYGFLKNIEGLVSLACDDSLFSSFEELFTWFDTDTYYSDLLVFSEELKKKLELESMTKKDIEDGKIDFLKGDTLYKILFTGFSYDDVRELPRQVKLQLIKKINSSLATEKVVPLAEGVDHVRCLYDFPLHRIHLGYDYRICYIRRGDVTAILGIKNKGGKGNDYSRYDFIAKNADKVYTEMQQFSLGIMPPSDTHIKTVELLQNVYNKSRIK